MSRDLPARPHLEHLRKQAKELLRELRQQNPDRQLADAQHAIARGYGFSSWPKLKAHVESMARPAEPAHVLVKENPFGGTWVANLSRSKRHPLNQFRASTIQFAVAGDTVTITHVGVDESGREQRGTHTVQADGRERPRGQRPGYVTVATWRGRHVLETVEKKDGQVLGRGTYEVSADGGTMTISDATGEQVIVLERLM